MTTEAENDKALAAAALYGGRAVLTRVEEMCAEIKGQLDEEEQEGVEGLVKMRADLTRYEKLYPELRADYAEMRVELVKTTGIALERARKLHALADACKSCVTGETLVVGPGPREILRIIGDI